MTVGPQHQALCYRAAALALILFPADHTLASDDLCASGSGIPSAVVAAFDVARLRRSLGEAGFSTGGSYVGESFVSTGGLHDGTSYDGVLWTYLLGDLHRAGLWKGLCFYADAFQIHGQSITLADVGSLSTVSSYEALPSTRLSELWIEQHLFDNRLSVRFGQLTTDTEFLLSSGASNFLNSTWGWATLPSLDLPAGGPSYPLATPGVRFAIKPKSGWDLKLGVYNGNPVGPRCAGNPQTCDNGGFDFSLNTPPLLIAEGSHHYNRAGRLPGTVKLGGWNDFGITQNQNFALGRVPVTVAFNADHRVGKSWALYGVADQLVWNASNDDTAYGVGVFVRVIGAPADENLIDFYLDGGFTFSGMIPRRPNDTIAIGVAYSGLSDDAHAVDSNTGQQVHLSHEMLLEFCYTVQPMPGWMIQPDFQYIWQPGGVSKPNKDTVPNAAVIGVRSTLNF